MSAANLDETGELCQRASPAADNPLEPLIYLSHAASQHRPGTAKRRRRAHGAAREFCCNPQTAASNAFQQATAASLPASRTGHCVAENSTRWRTPWQRAGVEVLIAADTPQPAKPDAIFPNNWVSFHHDGTVALYPMLAPNRRWERREEIIEQVVREGGFRGHAYG